MQDHIVFLDEGASGPDVAVRRPNCAHTWQGYERSHPDQVLERLRDATIAITNKTPLRKSVLEQLPKLRFIAVAATGTDIVDKAYCRERGIPVSNIRDYALTTVPEHTFALILALRRNLIGFRRDVQNGLWLQSGQFCLFTHPIIDLRGSHLGIIGEGALGQRVADIGKAFGMKVMFAAHKGVQGLGPLYTPWDKVLAESDVITLHAPLTPHTRDMIALAEFRQMRRKPLLINTARGGLVNERDLVTALDEGLVAGAGFDVVSQEPMPADHPFNAILDRPNVILTPHVAWSSREARQALLDQLIDNIENFVSGRPSNIVQGEF